MKLPRIVEDELNPKETAMIIILRILLLLAVAWLAFVLVRRVLGGSDKVLPKSKDKPELMQRCAYCDVHLPSGEATQSRGKIFCSEAHRDAYFQDHPND